ncbi:uncharacterized protein KGF55_004937 [Candida pseudojiufengensis]|uniref:uncharacterized protein n=1 Tax=Candida pseudojiufengensis TaxID=497109 RepID=UPI00222428E9|nr:uncharacterized protein KGF55_004937 [Candida pseudojiufengensis]KAI5960214.1 hypothetical protein KGF55_004937 [Candida pseudojiufengensis]
MTVSDFIREINKTHAITNNDQKFQALTKLLTISPLENKFISSIYNTTNHKVKNVTTQYDEEWPAFSLVVNSFVKFCAEMDPWSALCSFDLLTTYLNDLSVAFNNNTYGWLLSNVIKSTITMVIPISIKLDYQMFYKEQGGKYRLNYMASVILKIFNNIRINDSNVYKKSIILYLGNKLCFIYWKLDNPLLCINIFSNMNNTSLKMKEFPLSEQIKYKYYLGKFYFIKYEFIKSFENFEWCLLHTSSLKNQKLILENLIPISLIVGKRPDFTYLRSKYGNELSMLEFLNLFAQVSNAVKVGDYNTFKKLINENYKYLKNKGILLIMNKIDILILRNLSYKVWSIQGKQQNLNINLVPIPIPNSIPPNDHYFYKENVFVTLIDTGLIKGKLIGSNSIALSKVNPFPDVFDHYYKKFYNGSRSNNGWM